MMMPLRNNETNIRQQQVVQRESDVLEETTSIAIWTESKYVSDATKDHALIVFSSVVPDLVVPQDGHADRSIQEDSNFQSSSVPVPVDTVYVSRYIANCAP